MTKDMVVIGGGLAGMTLALQVLRQRADTTISIIEKSSFPQQEALGKVGESCVELAAHYFENVLGLKEHLDDEQFPKLGLRYFLEHGSDLEIHQRLEIGNNKFAPTPSYQIDRSRFENYLYELLCEQGVEFLTETQVREVEIGDNQHRVRASGANGSIQREARWLIDASGRTGVLRKHLDLGEKLSHSGTSCWWRLEGEFRIDDWHDDPAWSENNQGDVARWFSTNHLMGRGYWVWIIPLVSGATSIGIVADPEIHPFSQIHTFDKALAWLDKHETQLANIVRANRDKLNDFSAIKNYSYGCSKVFSPQRWALTGEAGMFIDPFYSPGSDFIALSNSYVCDLVLRDLQGEGINLRADLYNDVFLKFANSTTSTFRGQYEIIGNPLVMPIKVFWDWCFYWHFLARLYFEDKTSDLRFIANSRTLFERFAVLGDSMQELFKRWNAIERPSAKAGFLDLGAHPYLFELNRSLSERDPNEPFDECFARGLGELESLAREISAIFTKRTAQLVPGIEPVAADDQPIIAPFFGDLEAFLIEDKSKNAADSEPLAKLAEVPGASSRDDSNDGSTDGAAATRTL